jgi:hypothetical protein
VSVAGAGASLAVSVVVSRGSGCGWLACDDTVSVSDSGRPSP